MTEAWHTEGWKELEEIFTNEMRNQCVCLCLPSHRRTHSLLRTTPKSAKLVGVIIFIDGWRLCKTRPNNIKSVHVAFANDAVRSLQRLHCPVTKHPSY